MQYLLDTNICIYYFKGLFNLEEKIREIGFDEFAISEITLAELFYGVEKSQKRESSLKLIETFIEKIVVLPIFDSLKVYAIEKSRLKTKGTIISDLDLFSGATAIVNNLILVTRNISEFQRMHNINIENWIDNPL